MTCNHFPWFCQKVLPAVYDESLSYYEVVCKLTDYIKGLSSDQSHLVDMMNALNTDFQELQAEFTEITSQWSDYKTSMDDQFASLESALKAEISQTEQALEDYIKGETAGITNTVIENIKTYIDENLANFVAGIVKFVTFGLTKDGHFAAYIPEAWDFLEFTTPNDPASQFYGHLILAY